MSVDALNVTEDIQSTTRNYGILLCLFTGIICILCIIFMVSFGDCHPSEFNVNMVNGIIQTISITSGITFFIFGIFMAASSHFPNYLKFVNSKGFKPFWAIFVTLISITFLVASIWLYTILKQDDFICGQDATDVCPSGQTCKDGFCQSEDNSCSNCPSGQSCTFDPSRNQSLCSRSSNISCTNTCPSGKTCVNGSCQDANACATIDDPKHTPPIYTDSHKILFHCTAGLITMSCFGLLEGFRLLYDWLHETTAEKIEKVKHIIKEFESNPDAITQSKLKYIDDLLNGNLDDMKSIPDGYKLIKDAQEARNKMRVALKDQYTILKQAEEQATEIKLAEEYIRMYSKATTIVDKRAVLTKLCQNHPSNRDALFKRLQEAGGDDPLLKQSIGAYCNTAKSTLEEYKEKWNTANKMSSYNPKQLDLDKLNIYREMCSKSGAQEKSAFAAFVATEDAEFFKRFEIGDCSLEKIDLILELNTHTFSTDKAKVNDSLKVLQKLCEAKEEIFTFDQKKNFLEYLSQKFPSFFTENGVDKHFCALGGKNFAEFKISLLKMNDETLDKTLKEATSTVFSREDGKILRKSVSDFLRKNKGDIGPSVQYLYKDKLVGNDFVSPKSVELYEAIKSGNYYTVKPGIDGKFSQDDINAIRLCRDYGDCGDKQIFVKKLEEMKTQEDQQSGGSRETAASSSVQAATAASLRATVVNPESAVAGADPLKATLPSSSRAKAASAAVGQRAERVRALTIEEMRKKSDFRAKKKVTKRR